MKRGAIYRDGAFTYPNGNIVPKFLIVLNTLHLPTQPIIVSPCTSQIPKKRPNPGCNQSISGFFIEANKEYFPKDTLIQLAAHGGIDEKIFADKLKAKTIEFVGELSKPTVEKLTKCLERFKEDIRDELHQYLF